MAVQTKKPTSRAVVGSTKKVKKSKKLTPRMALFVLVGILAFSVLAGLGWQKWQVHQFKAKAAGWSPIVGYNDGTGPVQMYACTTALQGGYGPVWRVTIIVVNNSNWSTYSSGLVSRDPNGARVGFVEYGTPAHNYTVNTALYASQLFPDNFTGSMHGSGSKRPVQALLSC